MNVRIAVLYGLGVFIIALVVLTLASEPRYHVQLHVCYEDVVLVGTGEFDQGRWSAYVCGPALDDFHV